MQICSYCIALKCKLYPNEKSKTTCEITKIVFCSTLTIQYDLKMNLNILSVLMYLNYGPVTKTKLFEFKTNEVISRKTSSKLKLFVKHYKETSRIICNSEYYISRTFEKTSHE